MDELFQVSTVEDALIQLLDNLPPAQPETEEAGLAEAGGRVLAADIVPAVNLPPFDRSIVDGYAVVARDTFGASEGMPALLEMTGEVKMGEAVAVTVRGGTTVKIPTGGELPPGSDAVVMLEHTVEMGGILAVNKPVAPGANVATAGEDVRAGEVLLAAGRRLRPADVGALAGIGISRVPVFRRPAVAVLSTGDELVLPAATAGPGQIRDINTYSLAAAVEAAGGKALRRGIVADRAEALRTALSAALAAADMVLISGGSSVGARDFTPEVINSLGGPGVIVHGVSLKPGKPTILAAVDGKPVYGLPGHPVSALVVFDVLVRPVLRRLSGVEEEPENSGSAVKAVLTKSVRSTPGRTEYIRVTLSAADGMIRAEPLLGKSGSISTLVRADGVFVIPLGMEGVAQGEIVSVRLF